MATYETESDPDTLRWQRDNWMETARQTQKNADFHQQKRMELLRLLQEIFKTHPELVPQNIVEDFKVIDFWEKER